MFIDTHSHIYSEEFDQDRDEVITRAIRKGISKMILPNINSTTIEPLLRLTDSNVDFFIPLIGLHPTSVKEDYQHELKIVESWLIERKFKGIGEIGIDLFWDKTFINEQIEAFKYQLKLAKCHKMPVVIHVRDSFKEVIQVIHQESCNSLKGVFHSFTGNLSQAQQVIDCGFKIGVGGIVTFKNSGLDKIIQKIGLEHILIETDSPWLAPVPFRGRRNEPSYITQIAYKLAILHQTSIEEVAFITSLNANQLFNF